MSVEDLAAFKAEVRAFCAARMPPATRAKVILNQPLEKHDYVDWMKILQERRWLVGHWPEAHGGLGWSRLKRWEFENELALAGSPWLAPFGITYVGPVIYSFGDEAQKRRWLGPTANTDIWWAQGYSERGAGSDLANLKTSAVRDGDHYIVNGHKIWTSMARWADMMFALVRTDRDAKPQRGISFLLIDLKSPGVTIRPIRSIDLGEELNEVFLDEVRVPVENMVGEENRGWTYAKFLLDNERLLAAEVGKAQRALHQLRFFLSEIEEAGRPLIEDVSWRRRYAELQASAMALESVCREMFAEAEGRERPGPIASILKVMGSETLQAISNAHVDALSHRGVSFQAEALRPGWKGEVAGPEGGAGAVAEYLHGRVYSIWGGSNEVQRNIVASAVLGL